MEKDVLVSINGMQFFDGSNTDMEVISPGTYYYKNDKHYIMFDESVEGASAAVKNILKISNSKSEPAIEIIKSGGVGAHLVFERSRNNISCYETEFGNFMLGFHSKSIDVKHKENEIKIMIEYALEMNYEHISDNTIEMTIRSKSCGEALNL